MSKYKPAVYVAIAIAMLTLVAGLTRLLGVRVPVLLELLSSGAWLTRDRAATGGGHPAVATVPLAVMINGLVVIAVGCGLTAAIAAFRRGAAGAGRGASPTADQGTGTRQPDGGRSQAVRPASSMVSLRAIVSEMAEPVEGHSSFLIRSSGELVTLADSDRSFVEEGGPLDEQASQERRDELTRLRSLLLGGGLVELPTKYDNREFTVIEEFCDSVRDGQRRAQLKEAIHGPRAFRTFQRTLRRLGMLEQWERFRDEAFERIAIDWLEKNRITFDKAA